MGSALSPDGKQGNGKKTDAGSLEPLMRRHVEGVPLQLDHALHTRVHALPLDQREDDSARTR
jgi:hypothetical protein